MKLIHGGDWAGYQTEYGRTPLDFSENISPLGLPDRVRAASASALETADRYPDPLCRELRAALSGYHGLPAANIVCGNGASDLIYRLCHALRPKKAALFTPCFAEYAIALREAGSTVKEIPLSEDFLLTEKQFMKLPSNCELLFLCNPNNPTGLLTERKTLLEALELCRDRTMTLVIDECFQDFCEKAEDCSLIGELKDNPGLVILKAFTKTYAMAGLRLGYALCGSEALAERLQNSGQPWAVSNVTQAAGIAALKEKDYVNHLRLLIASERRRVYTALTELGLYVIPGAANYLLFQSPDTALAEKLRRRGILIRDCSNFAGLSKGWYRTAIRTAAENDILLDAIREVLHG